MDESRERERERGLALYRGNKVPALWDEKRTLRICDGDDACKIDSITAVPLRNFQLIMLYCYSNVFMIVLMLSYDFAVYLGTFMKFYLFIFFNLKCSL